MINESLFLDDKFWKSIEFIENLTGPILVKDIFSKVDIEEDELYSVLDFLHEFNYTIVDDEETNAKILYPPSERIEMIYDFTLSETYMIKKVEDALIKSKSLEVHCFDHSKHIVLPRQMIFLEGELAIVVESITGSHLTHFCLSEIQNIKEADEQYEAKYGELEFNDYIRAVKSIDDNEVRIVLKLKKGVEDLYPKFHHLVEPYSVANWNGEKIWAATIEKCSYLYEWLLSVQDNIEILDPPSLKTELINYCNEQIRKENLKKIS